MKTSPSRMIAATTHESEIAPGTPEEAYMAINRAKMLWSFRKRDVDSWREVIERWASEPKAWKRIPEMKPYGTAKKMIEAEVCENYQAFYVFVEAVLGTEWAMKLADNYADTRGGNNNPNGQNQYSGQSYAHNFDQSIEPKESARGTRKVYLSERIAKEHPEQAANIGKGKQFKTITEAAKKLGIIKDRQRVTIYIDNPEDAGQYLASRVDDDWMIAMYKAYTEAKMK